MRLTQDDEMVHALAPDRPDQPFGRPIGMYWPRRTGSTQKNSSTTKARHN